MRSIREAGIIGAFAGTSKVGKRLRLCGFFGGETIGAIPRRASFDKTFANLSPETRERCCAALYTSSSKVTVVLISCA
jgi:hypothetical protein